jgi:two-component system, cell cycle sensor histidine kinase and response regulator CckA
MPWTIRARKGCSWSPQIVAVLLDLVMPKKNGDEVFRELRSLSPELAIVLISGFHERGVREVFAGKIPAVFVEKPLQPAAILEALRSLLTSSA